MKGMWSVRLPLERKKGIHLHAVALDAMLQEHFLGLDIVLLIAILTTYCWRYQIH